VALPIPCFVRGDLGLPKRLSACPSRVHVCNIIRGNNTQHDKEDVVENLFAQD